MEDTNAEGDLKVDEAINKTVSSSSSPPPQPLTPSTSVLSPVLSIQSSGKKNNLKIKIKLILRPFGIFRYAK